MWYKAARIMFFNGKSTGWSVLIENFDTADEAIKAISSTNSSDFYITEVREFDPKLPFLRDASYNNGKVVYRDATSVTKAVEKLLEEEKERDKEGMFEGTMSYLLDCLLDENCFEEWLYLKPAVDELTDVELNNLLFDYGDDDFMRVENGKIEKIEDRPLYEFKIKEINLLSKEEYALYKFNIPSIDMGYWLKSPSTKQNDWAYFVAKQGDLLENRVSGEYAVRPVFTIENLVELGLNVGEKIRVYGLTCTIIDFDRAICNDYIGISPFRKDYKVSYSNKYETSDIKKFITEYFNYDTLNNEPILCGFVWCHGLRDFSCFELDSLENEDRYAIEEILAKYDTHGTSLRNCYDSKFSDALCEIY